MQPTPVRAARNGRCVAAILALLLVHVPALAVTVVIQPSDQDAFIMKNQPNRINGATNTRIRVEASPLGNNLRRGLVHFDIASTIPTGSTVTSAVIGLYASINAASPGLTHGAHRIMTPWEQNAVNWNNRPSFIETPSATALVGEGRGFKEFDVTADVQGAVNICSTDHGWLIKDVAENATADGVAYISREEKHPADLPNRPRLVVTFTPPGCVVDADCADTNFCTVNERCVAGQCEVSPLGCDDNDPCTEDICDCGQGCRAQPACNDGLSCTTDTCNPTTLECTNTPVDSACVTECSTGTCLGDPDSPDIEPGTGCVITSTEPAGTPCSDGDACTMPDLCDTKGTCVPGTKDCESPACENSPVCAEQCDNCIDDNQDGLVDRRDPKCDPLVDGSGQGAGDPKFRGKPVIRCQKAIRTAGLSFAKQLQTRLQRCTDGIFLCLQQKPGDATCLAKARTRCLKQTAGFQSGPTNLELRLGTKIAKACGPKKPGLLPLVPGSDLCRPEGLGFVGNVLACQTPQSAALLAAVTNAIAGEHRCRTAQLFAADVPRAAELLTAGGVDPATLPCLLGGAHGGNLGLGKPAGVAKAVVGCQRNIARAGARFVAQILAAEQRCSEAVAVCIQTKPGNAKCLSKAQSACRRVTSKLYLGAKSTEAKLRSTLVRACGSTGGGAPRVAVDDLRSALGLGYDTLQTTCLGLGVPGVGTLADVSECLVRQHVCRADQLLTSQTPRAHEFLTVGGAVGR